MSRIGLSIMLAVLYSGAFAQDITEIVLKDVSSGANYEMSNLKSKQAAVIVFWGNRCAYNSYYLGRIKALQQEYGSKGVEFILVNAYRSDIVGEESEEEMIDYLRAEKLSIPYLIDAEQTLKQNLGASRSPEVFVLGNRSGQLIVYYSGAIDDSPQSEGDVNHPYLAQAIISLLANEKPAVANNRPVGCLIR